MGATSSTDRASDYGSEGWGFESLVARKISGPTSANVGGAFALHLWIAMNRGLSKEKCVFSGRVAVI